MFQVRWQRRALDELTSYWLQADSAVRRDITRACEAIDQRLRDDPLNEGESRLGSRRITFEAPLAIVFRVVGSRRTVLVLEVRLFQPRGR
jgi:hypothetical protein